MEDASNPTVNVLIDKKLGDDKIPASSENCLQQKPKPKYKKKRKIKDSQAPRHPLSGYMRFSNDRRDAVRSDNPNLSFTELTKILASEWSNLQTEKKQQYLEAAEVDRERYTKEYNDYKQTEGYKLFVEQQKEKKMKLKEDVQKAIAQKEAKEKEQSIPEIQLDSSNVDIPIFTEEFLDHNKTRDAELRQLRKSNTDYEQQNAMLHKHIENMQTAIGKLETEIDLQEKSNSALQKHLDHLRLSLTTGFAGVRLPGIKDRPSLDNIDSYMTNLHSVMLENNSRDLPLVQSVRNVVGSLNFFG